MPFGTETAELKSNSQGGFSVNITLPDCGGANYIEKWSYGTPKIKWGISYDVELYDIAIPNSLPDGTSNYFHIQNSYAHICSEIVLETVY